VANAGVTTMAEEQGQQPIAKPAGDLSHLQALIYGAYSASGRLALTRGIDRSRALGSMAKALKEASDEILEANTLDLENSQELELAPLIQDWLKLTPDRLQSTIQMVQDLGALSDPIQQVSQTTFPSSHSLNYSQLMPLGVIALATEAFPELVAITAGLCLRTGNSLVVCGSRESHHSTEAIIRVLRSALEEAGLPEDCLVCLPAGPVDPLRYVATNDQVINLLIPYGRPNFIQTVTRLATVPVLRTGMGNCYLYWAPSGQLDTARWMILDSHLGQPDPVNSIEKVLIHRNLNISGLQILWDDLRHKGFELRGDAALVAEFPELTLAQDWEWAEPYLAKVVAFRAVDGLEEALRWMNRYSSGHADCLATESYQESRRFSLGLNSATTYINSSPRFYRNPNRGGGMALGMSNQRTLRRGRIGMEALTTVKQIVLGGGQE
jgi:glutamate-5-semialdehyde dehydrogenase